MLFRVTLSALLLLLASCSKSPEKHLLNAQAQLKAGQAADAEITFRKAMQQEPNNLDAKFGLAQALAQLGRPAEAWDLYGEVEKLSPQRVDVLQARAEIGYFALRHGPSRMRALEQQVEGAAEKLLVLQPSSAVGHRALGYLKLRLLDSQAARTHYEKAFAAAPEDPEIFRPLFGILLADNQEPEALALVDGLLKKNPRLDEAYQTLYRHQLKKQRPDLARDILAAKRAVLGASTEVDLEIAAHDERSGNPQSAQRILAELEAKQPGTPQYRLAVARYHASFGRLDQALSQIDTALERFPKQKAAFIREKASLLLASSKAAEAADLLAKAAAEFPSDLSLPHDEARVRSSLASDPAQSERAEKLFRDLIVKEPKRPNLHTDFARLLIASRRLEEADKELDEAIQVSPREPDPYQLRAEIALHRAAPGKALGFAQRGFFLRTADPAGAALMSRALMANGREQEAQSLLEVWRDSNAPALAVDLELASVYVRRGQPAKAEALLLAAQKSHPGDPRVATAVAEVYWSQKQPTKAMAALDTALRTTARPRPLLQLKADLLGRQGRNSEALALYQEISASAPKDLSSILRQVALAASAGDLNGAGQALAKAEALAPADLSVWSSKAWLFDERSEWKASEPIYRKLHSIEPRSANYANGLAWNLAMQGRYREARPFAEAAFKESPGDPAVIDTLAWIDLKTDSARKAKLSFAQLVQSRPADASYHYHLAEAHLALGETSASGEYAKARRKGKFPRECADLEDRLRASSAANE